MNQHVAYFIGGPWDLTKRVIEGGPQGDTFYVPDPVRNHSFYMRNPDDSVKLTIRVAMYEVRCGVYPEYTSLETPVYVYVFKGYRDQ